MADTKYWLVYRDNTVTRYRHSSEESANIEAARLSRVCPGVSFYVLEAKRYYITHGAVAVELEEDLPF